MKLVAVGVLALSSTIAMAGRVQTVPVTVTVNADGSGSANGNMATARASANDVEYIGCGVRKYVDATGNVTAYGFCQAGDAAGVTATEPRRERQRFSFASSSLSGTPTNACT
jgi:hypothetical protein